MAFLPLFDARHPVYQTAVAVPTLIICHVSVNQSSKDWEEAGTRVLNIRGKKVRALIILGSGWSYVAGKDTGHIVSMGVRREVVWCIYRLVLVVTFRQILSFPSKLFGLHLCLPRFVPEVDFPFLMHAVLFCKRIMNLV